MSLVRNLAAMACLVVCMEAQAAGLDLVAGPSVTSSGRATAAAAISAFGQPPVDGDHHFVPIATLGWVGARHTRVDDLEHQVWMGGGGVRFVSGSGHWFLGEQLMVTSGRTDALSSRFELMTSGGWQRGHFILMLRHVSNGHLVGGGKNLGETMLLAGVRW